MGCAPPPKKANLPMKESPVGLLRVAVLGTEFQRMEKHLHPNLKIRVSNQVFKTTIIKPPTPEDRIGEIFTYCINSFYKPYGRTVEVGYF